MVVVGQAHQDRLVYVYWGGGGGLEAVDFVDGEAVCHHINHFVTLLKTEDLIEALEGGSAVALDGPSLLQPSPKIFLDLL